MEVLSKPRLTAGAAVAVPVAFAFWICWLAAKAVEHVPSPHKEKERSNW